MEEVRLYGRRKIYTDYAVVDSSNVVEVLGKTLMTHQFNSRDIQYLYDYYKGRQPILERVKEVRPEINNMVVVNRANEIVSFKVGYLMGEPVQYVSRSEDESVAGAINELNSFVFAEDKAAKDKELADWFTICGTAYRMVLPDALNEEDEAPLRYTPLTPGMRMLFIIVVWVTNLCVVSNMSSQKNTESSTRFTHLMSILR